MNIWDQITGTIRSEFSDLPDAEHLIRIILRLSLAALLGGVIGYEREQKGKAAGLRTHMLMSMGAALFVYIPQSLGASTTDLTRVLQGLLAGVGFLVAGTIVKSKEGEEIKGLTTAATIWPTAAIGVAAGMGREATAVLSTVLTVLILATIPKVADMFGIKSGETP